ncbi:MAG: hypothetical protein A2W03_08460 [Candidatus Aminicenantes bacterium RBG_16_63_16]|nr:MAG: hypothetical protein A2W03_08460 [Candidatus Aminicenantes bacterium RBG_16_63_16]
MKKGIWILALVVMVAAFSFGQGKQASPAGDRSGQLPPEQAQGQAPLIMGYDVAPGAGQDISDKYPTNSELGYKGVVMANFNSADAADEIVVDFGAQGLWYYNNGNWLQISGLNPDSIIAALTITSTDDEIIADFGATGLWYWDGNTWFQMSGVNATGMFATDDDSDGIDDVHVDFGALGVWRFDFDSFSMANWRQLSNLNPYEGLRMDFRTAGYEEGLWSFPTYGLWNIWFFGANPVYNQLTGTVTIEDDFASSNFASSSGAEDVVADFAGLGLWMFRASDEVWYQISSMSANRVKEVKFVGGQDYELLAEDNAGGLYWGNWNGASFTWTLITNSDIGPSAAWCETFDEDGTDSGDEEVIIPLTGAGALKYDYSAGPALTTWISDSPAWYISCMVKGDYYGRGYDSTLAVVFSSASAAGAPGLWLYDKQATWGASWAHISNSVPDGLY